MSVEGVSSLSEALQIYKNPGTSNEERRELLVKFPNLINFVSADSTEYQISDEDYNDAKARGRQSAADATGYNGKNRGGTTRTLVDTIGGAGSFFVGYFPKAAGVVGKTIGKMAGAAWKGIKSAANWVGDKVGGLFKKGSGTSAVSGATGEAQGTLYNGGAPQGQGQIESTSSNNSGGGGGNNSNSTPEQKENKTDASLYVTVALATATAAGYWIKKPNKEQVEATQTLMNEQLPEAQGYLAEAQDEMVEAEGEIAELAEEAEDTNEAGQEQIETDKTLFDFYRERYNTLKTKAESGQTLTPDEKAEMKKLAPLLGDLSEGINTTVEETSESINDLNEEIGEYQDTFDNSAETIGEVEGLTDYAEDFDTATRNQCYIETAAQALNAAGAYKAGGKLLSTPGIFNKIIGGIGIAAGLSSTRATTEQMGFASKVNDEIEVREITQDLTGEATDMYDEKVETLAGTMEYIEEDLLIETPDDIEVPVDTASSVPAAETENANPFGIVQNKEEDNSNIFANNKKKPEDVN